MSEWFEKPRKKSRWKQFKDWCYDNDFWEKVCATFLTLALIGGVITAIVWICEPEPGDLITEGVIIDMGHYVSGRSTIQYGCWIKIRSDDGTVGTWDVSDTVYKTISIGDWVEKKEVKP